MPRPRPPHKPSVLVLEEKDQRRFVSALTVAELHRAALVLVKERHARGWYPTVDSFKKPAPPSISREAANGLPEGPTRQTALREWRTYRQELEALREVEGFSSELGAVLITNSGAEAWKFLDSRRDFQYEGFQLHPLETFEEPQAAPETPSETPAPITPEG